MTHLEIVLVALLWIILGLFICHKANWFKHFNVSRVDPEFGACFLAVTLAPLIFLFDFINRFFIQKWH